MSRDNNTRCFYEHQVTNSKTLSNGPNIPSIGPSSPNFATYAITKLGKRRHFLAIFTGYNTSKPVFLAETRSRGRARRAVEGLLGKIPALKDFEALKAFAHAERWWLIEDLESLEVAA